MSWNSSDRRRAWLALARVGNAVGNRAAERFRTAAGPPGSNLEEAFTHPEVEEPWCAVLEAARRNLERAESEMVAADRIGARVIDVEDDEYPFALRQIPDAPLALFVRGKIEPCDARAVAVIGMRESTRYGALMTRRIVEPLAHSHVTIVSGLAKGIDSHAHRAALECGARTIGVLGTGIDVCYPRSSRDLYEKIPSQGAVISETPPGTIALPYVFLARNRIVSGLSKATVVIESRAKSGTHNTVRWAHDQGRDVYAVPGDADLGRSEGTNALIASGDARLLTHGAGILRDTLKELYVDPDVAEVTRPEMLDPIAARIRDLLGAEPLSIDAILPRAGVTVSRLLAVLSGLERRGMAKRDECGRYARFGKSVPSG